MAELLIYARTDPDAARRTAQGGYRVGDVVVVMPNGNRWGREEVKTHKFYILRVPALTVAEAEELTQEQISGILDADGDPIFIRRREFWLDESLLAANARAMLHANALVLPVNLMRNIKKRKPV